MQVVADLSGTGLTVISEQCLEFLEVISIWTEVTKITTGLLRLSDLLTHLITIKFVETVSLDGGGVQVLTKEDMLYRRFNRTGSGTG